MSSSSASPAPPEDSTSNFPQTFRRRRRRHCPWYFPRRRPRRPSRDSAWGTLVGVRHPGGASVTNDIRRVAVLGAGTMGAAIAAHAANAGLAVDLLDMAPERLDPDEERRGLGLEDPAVRNRIVKAGFQRMLAARPAALASPRLAEQIRLGNFDDHFDRVTAADWVVEAIVERLEPKQELFARVEKAAAPDAVVTSNTS